MLRVKSLQNKIHEFEYFLKENRIDVTLITETWFKTSNKVYIRGYTCYRQDRPHDPWSHRTPGGGVAIFIRTAIKHQIVPTPNAVKSLECKIIKILTTNNQYINIAVTYNKPQSILESTELEEILNTCTRTVIAGDLNAKHSDWNCPSNNSSGQILKIFIDNSVYIMKHSPTPTFFPDQSNYSPSTIDLAIVKNISISELETHNTLSSNHIPVTFHIKNEIPKLMDKSCPNFSEANWKLFKEELNKNIVLPPALDSTDDIDEAVRHITELIRNASLIAVPVCKQTAEEYKLPEDILRIIRQRNRVRIENGKEHAIKISAF